MLEAVGHAPGVRDWRMAQFERAFAAGQRVGTCRGVFATAGEAAASAPPTRALGYDHVDAGAMYRDRMERAFSGDYPMMVWLQRALNDGARRVYDLGGHIGLSYYVYQRYLAFPPELRWTVHDVPAVMVAGRIEAERLDTQRRLDFTEDRAAAADADCLFSAGCLQYLEDTLADRLAALQRRPRWVLVNLLPLHPERAYWTLQSIGTAYCPYRIQRTADFFGAIEALGYERLETWENLDKSCWVAYDPEHSLDRYHGAAFRLR